MSHWHYYERWLSLNNTARSIQHSKYGGISISHNSHKYSFLSIWAILRNSFNLLLDHVKNYFCDWMKKRTRVFSDNKNIRVSSLFMMINIRMLGLVDFDQDFYFRFSFLPIYFAECIFRIRTVSGVFYNKYGCVSVACLATWAIHVWYAHIMVTEKLQTASKVSLD